LGTAAAPTATHVGGKVQTRLQHQLTLNSSLNDERNINNHEKDAVNSEQSDSDSDSRLLQSEQPDVAVDTPGEEDSEEQIATRTVSDVSDRLQVEIQKSKDIQQTFMNGRIRRKRIHLAVLKPSSAADSQLSLLEMMLSFQRALMHLFDDVLKDVSQDDLVQVVLSAPGLSHHISTKLVKRSIFSVEFVLAVVQERAQSSFDLRIGEGIGVDVIIVKSTGQGGAEALGGCRRGLRAEQRRKPRPNVVRINNPQDLMCCARAIGVCLGSAIEKRSTGYTVPQPLIDLWGKLTEYNARVKGSLTKVQKHYCYEQIKKGDEGGRRTCQQVLARRLCEVAGIDPNRACGINEIKQFEDKLGVRIKIVDAQAFNSFTYHGRRAGESRISLYLLREKSAEKTDPCSFHYDAIVDVKQFFRHKYFCHACNEGFNYKSMHKCDDVPDFCTTCYERNCKENRTFSYKACDICFKPFRSIECKFRHEKLKDEICVQIFCHKCHWRGKREFLKEEGRFETKAEVLLKRHGKCEVACNVCKRVGVGVEHECYMQRQPFKKHVNKVVYLDFESRQEDGEHIPIYCFLKWRFLNSDGSVKEEDSQEIGIGENVQNDVGDFLFSPKFRDSVVVAHNMRAYDGCFLLRYVIENGYKPSSLILNGMKMMTWVIPKFNIRIVDSLNFLPMTLADMPKAFGLSMDNLKKGFFPHFFSAKSTLTYKGPYPPPADYGYDSMTSEKRQEFDMWYAECLRKNQIFDFEEELKMYCKQDVEILFQGFESFRTLVKDLSAELLEDADQSSVLKVERNPVSHEWLSDDSRRKAREHSESKLKYLTDQIPCEVDFQRNCDPLSYLTLAALCHAIFKRCFLEDKMIAVVPPGGYRNHSYSKKQIEFLEYMLRTKYPRLKHVLNTASGECKLGNLRFDGFDHDSKTVFEFYGCFYHGCLKCVKNPDTISPVAKISYRALYEQTKEREKLLLQDGFKVIFVWECEWEAFKKKNWNDDVVLRAVVSDMEHFIPIDPRTSYKGGRTETYKMESTGEDLKYVDVNSLYPFVLSSKYFPVGHPQVAFNPPGVDISQYFGFVRCSVVPPSNLYHPVLPYTSNGKLLFPLCRTCAVQRITTPCEHGENERSLTDTWFSEELKLAVEKGYRVTKVYQVMHFMEKSKELFKRYVQNFYKLKLMASGLPKSLLNEEEVETFLQEVHEKSGFKLTREDFSNPNPARRWLTKIMLNSFYGRFGMKEDRKQTEFICSNSDLDKLLLNTHVEITALIPQTDSVCMVEYENVSKDVVEMSNNTNVYVASVTTAYARMELYRYLDMCATDDGSQSRAVYCDTDSIIYKKSSVSEDNLPEGLHLGDLTNELDDDDCIEFFYSTGPKSYCYRTRKGRECMRMKGFQMSRTNEDVFNVETMDTLIQNYLCKNVDNDGRVSLPSKKDDASHRAKLMALHQESQNNAVFLPEIGMSCLNPRKIYRSKEWRLLNKPEQKMNKIFYDKRVSLLNGETFPYGYIQNESGQGGLWM
jgi:hypothetical protein